MITFKILLQPQVIVVKYYKNITYMRIAKNIFLWLAIFETIYFVLVLKQEF